MPGSAIRKSCAIAILETQERGCRGSRVSSCYFSETATCDASARARGQTPPEGSRVPCLRKAIVGCPSGHCILPRQEPPESQQILENRNRVRRATRGTVFSSAGPGRRKPASGVRVVSVAGEARRCRGAGRSAHRTLYSIFRFPRATCRSSQSIRRNRLWGGQSLRLRPASGCRSEEHTSELQSLMHLVCRLLL